MVWAHLTPVTFDHVTPKSIGSSRVIDRKRTGYRQTAFRRTDQHVQINYVMSSLLQTTSHTSRSVSTSNTLEVQKPYKFPLPHFYNYSSAIHFTSCLISPPIHLFVNNNMLPLMYTFFRILSCLYDVF